MVKIDLDELQKTLKTARVSFGRFKPKRLVTGLEVTNTAYYTYIADSNYTWRGAKRYDPDATPWDRAGYYIDVPAIFFHSPCETPHENDNPWLIRGEDYWICQGSFARVKWCVGTFLERDLFLTPDIDKIWNGIKVHPRWVIPVPKSACYEMPWEQLAFQERTVKWMAVVHD